MSNLSVNFSQKIEKLKFNLQSYDKLTFEKGWCSIPHSHPYCEIFIITNGNGSFLSEQASYPVKKGNIILTNPFISHTEYCDNNINEIPFEYTVISIGDVSFTDENQRPFSSSKIIDASNYWNDILKFLNIIDKELISKKRYWESVVEDSINSLLVQILRISKFNNLFIPDTIIDRNSHIVVSIKNYIEEFYQNNITLEELEKQFYMNKYSLIRKFKSVVGCTPFEYLEKTRIERAKQLISKTNFSLTEIAIQVGFNNTSYFSKKFKEITDMTPTQFLKSTKK